MTRDSLSVGNLNKVTLLVEAGTSPQTMDLTPGPYHFEFIFGVGPTGMTPFEYELLDKKAGESIILELNREDLKKIFEHIDLPVLRLIDGDVFFLKAIIVKVVKAKDREVVKATAAATGCSSQCGMCGEDCDF